MKHTRTVHFLIVFCAATLFGGCETNNRLELPLDLSLIQGSSPLEPFAIADQQSGKKVTVLYTNNLEGQSEAENRVTHDVGGLKQLSHKISRIRKELIDVGEELLLVDAGDMLFRRQQAHRNNSLTINNRINARHIFETYAALDYDAVVFGEADFSAGIPFIQELIDSTKVPIVLSNVRWKNKKREPFFTEKLIVKKNGIRIGLLGVLEPKLLEENKSDAKKFMELLPVEPRLATLSSQLRQEGADMVVVLAHHHWQSTKKLAERLRGVDLLIGGHDYQRTPVPRKLGNTYLVQAVRNGKQLGLLRFVLRTPGAQAYDGSSYVSNLEQQHRVHRRYVRHSNHQAPSRKLVRERTQRRIDDMEVHKRRIAKELSEQETKNKNLIFNTLIAIKNDF